MNNDIILRDSVVLVENEKAEIREEKFEYLRFINDELTIMFNDFKHFIINVIEYYNNVNEYKFKYVDDDKLKYLIIKKDI